MNTLEFENTQGISLQYPTAGVVERGVSLLIDLAILGAALLILELSFQSIIINDTIRVIAILAPIFIFYTLLMEVFNDGRSIGKMIMGLKVVRIDGRYTNAYDYLMRWIFRWVDIYITLGSLAAIMVGGTPRSQRIGDLLADTTVIRTRNLRVPLSRVFNLKKLADHKISYPQVKELKEEQVLLIKETLNRARIYKNTAHNLAVVDLAKRLSKKLDVPINGSPNAFLNTIIKDYISITR